MFSIKIDDLRELEKDLLTFRKRAFPFATKSTVNTAAFETRKESHREIEKDMTLRNRWTKQSVQVDQTRTLDVSRQESHVGSIEQYMHTQEFGGTKTSTGKHGTPIATPYSSGEGEGARPRMRLPRKINKLRNIQLTRAKIKKGKGRKQRNAIIVNNAAEQGIDHVVLKTRNGTGLYRVIGDDNGVDRVYMVHNLNKRSVKIKKNSWLKPATKIVTGKLPDIYAEALRFQLKRLGVFKKRLHG